MGVEAIAVAAFAFSLVVDCAFVAWIRSHRKADAIRRVLLAGSVVDSINAHTSATVDTHTADLAKLRAALELTIWKMDE